MLDLLGPNCTGMSLKVVASMSLVLDEPRTAQHDAAAGSDMIFNDTDNMFVNDDVNNNVNDDVMSGDADGIDNTAQLDDEPEDDDRIRLEDINIDPDTYNPRVFDDSYHPKMDFCVTSTLWKKMLARRAMTDRIRLEDINIDPDTYNPRVFDDSYHPKMDFCVTSTLWKKMLARRAMTEMDVAEINDTSHGVPENTDKLVDILFDIHSKRQRIVILPDFDMDGISAGTLGFAGLAELGFTVSLYIPDPNEGYGFGPINIDPDTYNPRVFDDSYHPKMDFCVTSTLWKKMLARRAMTEMDVAEINDTSHGVPENTDKLVDILFDIHSKRQRIVILPDFDMDGISAGTVGFAGLAELGFTVSLYIPDPNEGYGFGPEQVDRIVMQYPDVAAIITCDNGITCVDGIDHGTDWGIRRLVTDHHQPGKMATNAEVEVDPMRKSDDYVHPQICGAVVLWQVLSAYAAKYCDTFMREQIARLVVFAGFGTVSDCMPMMYENRAFVSRSIDILRLVYDNGSYDFVNNLSGCDIYLRLVYDNGSYDFVNNLSGCDIYRAAFKGLRVMLDAFVDKGYFDPVVTTELVYDNGSYDFVNNLSGCDIYRAAFKGLRVMLDAFVDKGYFDPVVTTEKFYGWSLAPTFNSVKRLGEDMHDAFGVFFDVANAQAHMRRLIELNELRKQLVNREYQRLVTRLEDGDMPYGPYIFVTDSDPGVAGLLATKRS